MVSKKTHLCARATAAVDDSKLEGRPISSHSTEQTRSSARFAATESRSRKRRGDKTMAACRLASASASASAQLVRVDWASSSISGDGLSTQVYVPVQRKAGASCPPIRMMANPHEGKGLFAPLVVVARNVLGKKPFNQLRGKAIALHSQVIGEFCKSIGADAKQRQGLIRLAKKNGEKLGFLA